MDYWEFLLQKEGDRTWLPIKSPQLDLDVGRYRVVAHSSRANTDVEICVTHTDTNETPPKRRYQKRSRRTNPDGLMVIIPFTYLKPGLWELRCCGDIMSDFLGNSWQETVQLSVVPKVSEVFNQVEGSGSTGLRTFGERSVEPRERSVERSPIGQRAEDSLEAEYRGQKVEGDEITPEMVNNDSAHPEELHSPLITSLHSPETEEVLPTQEQPAIADNDSLNSSHPVAQSTQSPSPTELPTLTETISLPQTHTPSQTPIAATETSQTDTEHSLSHPTNGKIGDREETTSLETKATSPPPEALPELEIPEPDIPIQTSNPSQSPISNPILDQSLQMLEQVLQQVLDPVIKEFEASESSELPIPISPESEISPEEDTSWQGLILTLEEEALVTQRRESLTVAGQVDQLNVHQLDPRETVPSETNQFQGILQYELRHPQTGEVVVDVRTPIATPAFPVTFSQTLEIPSDSKTCLLLGKVNLYESMGTALASQPFTVTVNLDELLVAVQSGNWTKSEDTTAGISTPKPKSQSIPLNQIFLDLVDNPNSRKPLIYQPSSHQPLPPQLYQRQSQPRLTKSLDLPTFSVPKPTIGKESESLEEIQPEIETRSQAVEPTDKQTTETTPSAPDDTTEDFVIDSSVTESLVSETTERETNETISVPHTAVAEASVQAETATDSAEPSKETPPLEDNLAALAETSEQASTESTEISDVWTSTPEAEPESSQGEEISNSDLSKWKTAAMSSAAPIEQDPIAVDRAFTQLNLNERFWGRLNALMTDTDLAEWLKVELPPSEDLVELEGELSEPEVDPLFAQPEEIPPSSDDEDQELNGFDESMWDEDTEEVGSLNHQEIPKLEPPVQPDHPPLNREELLEREIVVEDESPTTESSASGLVGSRTIETETGARSHLRTSDMAQLDLGTPLPTPELFIPTQELAAGEPLLVKIKLNPHSARLGVKLWVQDRQSRSLLDGPRWLMELSPNKAGELEALTQLVVPFGTVEIRFEAITVDLDSERESHKVSVDRVVVPPDLSDLSEDEF
ncbi:hypothetical protein [Coleofasciculus sp.]|uniref:hypothetical protein n=1 Tax=Coleofasciculus sp. TaxID=3100458 RepID=UPI003A32131C